MSGQCVLVIDDELHIRRLLRSTLERVGYRVLEAATASEGLDAVAKARPDAVLLDLGLPDRDGLELIPLLRKADYAVIIISAREATDQKVAALDLGATDYVTKPFDTEELLARVRAALRGKLAASGTRPVVQAGTVEVDLGQRRITREGEEVHLTRKEYEVLSQLALAPGRVVTHQRILEHAWPHDYDKRVEYLRIVIRNLRQKLEADPADPHLIKNELGVGYRLMAD